MEFLTSLKTLLKEEKIECVSCIPLADAIVRKAHLLPEGMKTVAVLLAPYDGGAVYSDGVSAYAHIYDYHRYFSELFRRILPKLRECYPENRFFGFADHSPIDEKDAAAKAGLGVLGKHSLLLNERYGSFVFIGCVLTDLEIDCKARELRFCTRCGECSAACPVGAIGENGIDAQKCLSAVSQKKTLSEEELALLRKTHTAWGCDRCQNACPYNRKREFGEIPFFSEHRDTFYTSALIEAMSEKEFASHAFSWRGRERILQNLENLEKIKENS